MTRLDHTRHTLRLRDNALRQSRIAKNALPLNGNVIRQRTNDELLARAKQSHTDLLRNYAKTPSKRNWDRLIAAGRRIKQLEERK